MADPKISVVVCTRDRASVLKRCLSALERQTLPDEHYEVILVDNGSTDETAALIASFCERNANFRGVYEVRPGLSLARNRGAREAPPNSSLSPTMTRNPKGTGWNS